jgi:hypothetical protein
MALEVVRLTTAHLSQLPFPEGIDSRAYFSKGSVAFCVLDEGVPVFAGGVVNLEWSRGEAWVVPTPYMRSHLRKCLFLMRQFIPYIAQNFKFRRVQATCVSGVSTSLFKHLGFTFEGTMAKFGPNGETCDMHSRTFEVTP